MVYGLDLPGGGAGEGLWDLVVGLDGCLVVEVGRWVSRVVSAISGLTKVTGGPTWTGGDSKRVSMSPMSGVESQWSLKVSAEASTCRATKSDVKESGSDVGVEGLASRVWAILQEVDSRPNGKIGVQWYRKVLPVVQSSVE
jgi:hypothetical protein